MTTYYPVPNFTLVNYTGPSYVKSDVHRGSLFIPTGKAPKNGWKLVLDLQYGGWENVRQLTRINDDLAYGTMNQHNLLENGYAVFSFGATPGRSPDTSVDGNYTIPHTDTAFTVDDDGWVTNFGPAYAGNGACLPYWVDMPNDYTGTVHPYNDPSRPSVLKDVVAVLQYVIANAAAMNIDVDSISVTGTSAGHWAWMWILANDELKLHTWPHGDGQETIDTVGVIKTAHFFNGPLVFGVYQQNPSPFKPQFAPTIGNGSLPGGAGIYNGLDYRNYDVPALNLGPGSQDGIPDEWQYEFSPLRWLERSPAALTRLQALPMFVWYDTIDDVGHPYVLTNTKKISTGSHVSWNGVALTALSGITGNTTFVVTSQAVYDSLQTDLISTQIGDYALPEIQPTIQESLDAIVALMDAATGNVYPVSDQPSAVVGETSVTAPAQVRTMSVYELLPNYIRDHQDPDGALAAWCGAMEREFVRHRQEITHIAAMVDPYGVSIPKRYTDGGIIWTHNNWSGQSWPTTKFNAEQYLVGTAIYPNQLQFPSFYAAFPDNFFVGFGVMNLRNPTTDTPTDAQASVGSYGKYRKIISYDAATQIATLDKDWRSSDAQGGSYTMTAETFEGMLCVPNFAYLPVKDRADTTEGTQHTWQGHILNDGTANPNYNMDSLLAPEWDCQEQGDNFIGMYVYVTFSPIPLKDPASDAVDHEGVDNSVQVRKIVDMGYINGVLSVDEPFDRPPSIAHKIGIIPNNVSLNYLASMVGYQFDARDPEVLQRQQIQQATQFYKLKGTERSFETLLKAVGYEVSFVEGTSKWTDAPQWTPGQCDPDHPTDITGIDTGSPDDYRLIPTDELYTVSYHADAVFDEPNPTSPRYGFDALFPEGDSTITLESKYLQLLSQGQSAYADFYISQKIGNPSIAVTEFSARIDAAVTDQTIATSSVIGLQDWRDDDSTDFCKTQLVKQGDGTWRLRIQTEGTGWTNTDFYMTEGVVYNFRSVIGADPGLAGNGFWQFFAGPNTPTLVYEFQSEETVDNIYLSRVGVVGASTGSKALAIDLFNFTVGTIKTDSLMSSPFGELDTRHLTQTCLTDGSEGNTDLRVPDSDIVVFMKNSIPGVPFTDEAFAELTKRIEDIRPAHVEIAFLAIGDSSLEGVRVVDAEVDRIAKTPRFEIVDTVDAVTLTPTGSAIIPVLPETGDVVDAVALKRLLRWDGDEGYVAQYDTPHVTWDSTGTIR